jgi:hypothetical protein
MIRQPLQNDSDRRLWLVALWHMRWPAVYICGPVVGLVLVNLFFGLPDHLWFLAAGFFGFSAILYAILVRGEIRRLRRHYGAL